MTLATVGFSGQMEFCLGQSVKPSQDWTGYCQMFSRMSVDVAPLFGSAWAQWLGVDDEDKHAGGSPDDAPLGSFLLFKGSSPFGHIMPTARDFRSGSTAGWSNDLVVTGQIDKVHRTAPITEWHQNYLGYITAINDVDVSGPVVKPKENQRYKSVDKAIQRIEHARDVARTNGDAHDVAVFNRQIRRMKKMYRDLRHA